MRLRHFALRAAALGLAAATLGVAALAGPQTPAPATSTATAPAATAAATAAPAADAAAIRMQTFEQVWKTVNDKFYDPNFNGVDWNAVRATYAPKVAALTKDDDLYPLLNAMLHELKASHFGILPPQLDLPADGSSVEEDDSFGGEAGLTVRIVEGRPTITRVTPDGPAAKAGLRPGFVVTRVGTHDLAELHTIVAARKERPIMERFLERRTIEGFLNGMPGKAVEVAYLDANDAPHTASLVRVTRAGKPVKLGELPTTLVETESRRLDGGFGYVRFNIFFPVLVDSVRGAIRSFADAPGIVVDLRNNPGGVGAMAPAIAALFEPTSISLGTMQLRHGNLNFISYQQDKHFDGPVVVLTDEGSASTSEILAGGMQELGRATVIGEPTLGAVLPSVVEKLPNGAVFQYAVADFKTPKGVLLEGRGVTPDIVLAPTRRDYLASGSAAGSADPVLDAAVKYLREKTSKPAASAAATTAH